MNIIRNKTTKKRFTRKNFTATSKRKTIVIISKNTLNPTLQTYLHVKNFKQIKKGPTDTFQNKHSSIVYH
jgi:hypothetical protein